MDEQFDSVEELTLPELIQETFREYEKTKNEMNEIGVLVKQSAAVPILSTLGSERSRS